MGNIELHLDERVIERVRRLAEARHSSVEAVLTDIIERGVAGAGTDRGLGVLSDAPTVMDDVVESVLAARETAAGEQAALMAELAAWEAASDEDWLKVEQSMSRAD